MHQGLLGFALRKKPGHQEIRGVAPDNDEGIYSSEQRMV
jgi:hypothetical protein